MAQNEVWTQPTLTANGTLGGETFAVAASSEYNGAAFNAINDNKNSWVGAGYPVWFVFYNPTALTIGKLSIGMGGDYMAFNAYEIQISEDGETWTTIHSGNSGVSGNGSYQTFTVDLTQIENHTSKYWRIYCKTPVISLSRLAGITRLQILDASETSPIKDIEVIKSIKNYILKRKKRTYWKNIPFVVPALTENGTMGGTSFATANSVNKDAGYRVFNGGASGTEVLETYPNAAPQWLSFYNPEPIKISQLQIGQYKQSNESNNYYFTNFSIQVSDNGTDWINVFNSTASQRGKTVVTVDISNSGFHQYYRVYVSAANYYSGYPRVVFSGITLTEAYTRAEVTPEDYDFYEDMIPLKTYLKKFGAYDTPSYGMT